MNENEVRAAIAHSWDFDDDDLTDTYEEWLLSLVMDIVTPLIAERDRHREAVARVRKLADKRDYAYDWEIHTALDGTD